MNKELYDLTNPQKSIWLTEEFYKGSAVNNICGTVIIDDVVNFDKLIKAINIFIRDNDSFRIHIDFDNTGNVKQYISDYTPVSLTLTNLISNDELLSLEKELSSLPFDLINKDLFNIRLFRFTNGSGGFIVVANHLIADACTAGLLANKVINIYTSLIKNLPITVDSTSYLNYINSEKEYLSSSKFEKDKCYWDDKFNEAPEVATIPYLTSPNSSTSAERKSFIINHELVSNINAYCKENSITIFNFFMSLYAVYIGKVSDLDNFVLGTPILNRTNFIEKNTPGMFISTVPFKFSLNSSDTFIDFAQKVSLDSLGMFRHQKYPYQSILEHIRTKNPAQANLYDILISYQNTKTNRNYSDVPYEVRWTFNNSTADSLDINIYDMNDTGDLNIAYDYQTTKYSHDDINNIHLRILNMLDVILKDRNIQIKNIEIITPREKDFIFNDFNNTSFEYDKTLTLIDLFEAQVAKSPQNTAIIYDNVAYSYYQLNNLVNYISNLIAKKKLFNKKIAVLAKKSLKTVATFLAIMKTGNCYIPIDPTYPAERINYIIENSNCDLLICDKSYVSYFPNSMVLTRINLAKEYKFTSLAKPDMLAYMIYTSGSTGKPKGVQIKHRNIINTLIWRRDYYKFDKNITVFQVPSFSFDSSVEDIYTPLISGAKLLIPNFPKIDINKICEYIKKYNVNHFLVVPSLYKILLSEKSDYLKYFKHITIAGENFNQNLVKEHFSKLPNVRLINEYGPTENSVCSTYYEFTKDLTEISIGRPLNNCKCLVLNHNLDVLPPNTPGELYLAGPGLSIGYLNRPDLTAERFLTTDRFDYRIYKTGDIVKYNETSGLNFVGRNDSQIKFHGFRIELQEISNVILKDKEIKDVITLFKDLGNDKKIIISYLIVTKAFDKAFLENLLKSSLPYYMVPELIVMDSYPTTPNGKIDFNALPTDLNSISANHKEPTTTLEQNILKVCKQVLSNNALYIDDNIFTVGLADSLNILTITSKLYAMGIKIPTQQFYELLTIENIAKNYTKKVSSENENIVSLKYKTDPLDYTYNNSKFNFSNVLLTGTTGFLGIHILYYLLTTTSANIKCIVRRKSNTHPHDRLKDLFIYYFGPEKLDLFNERVLVIDGNLSYDHFALDQSTYDSLKTCDCVIHTAALTKHYGDAHFFYESNVVSTENLINFCLENNLVLNYMSTTSISGNELTSPNSKNSLSENDFYIGQNYTENIYVDSKYKAEELIIKAQYNGLDANIFRLGNLMGRSSDGYFQKNKYDNAFYMKLLVISKLKTVPLSIENFPLDFSPIDDVARAIINLLYIPNLKNCIFHLTNPNTICAKDLIAIFNKFGINIEYTNSEDFLSLLVNNSSLMKYFVSDLSNSTLFDIEKNVTIKNEITNTFLSNLGFEWPKINEEYIRKFINKTNFIQDLKEPIIV